MVKESLFFAKSLDQHKNFKAMASRSRTRNQKI